MKRIAGELGVSITTVSKALNNHDDIGHATRARVLAKVAELGYQPNAVARSLTTRRRGGSRRRIGARLQQVVDLRFDLARHDGFPVLAIRPHGDGIDDLVLAVLLVLLAAQDDLHHASDNKWGAPNFDDLFFAEDEVFTAGQPIAIVLATSKARAADGVRAVKIEYENLPAIFTMEEAIEKESFHEFYRYLKKGDTDEAFKNCDYTFSGVTRMGGQEHFYLETNACLCIPKPEDGEMEIWTSSQNPNER